MFHVGLDHLRMPLLKAPYLGDEFSRCLRALQVTWFLSGTEL